MSLQHMPEHIQATVNTAVKDSQNGWLTEIRGLISTEMNKISDSQKQFSDLQINKINQLSVNDYKFKRRSSEEQFKVNSKVMQKVQETSNCLQTDKIDEAKENLVEGIRFS